MYSPKQPQSPISVLVQEEATELLQEVLHCTGELDEDISRICKLGLQVDNDREPAPQSIPTAATMTCEIDPTTFLCSGQSWGWNGNYQCPLTTPTIQKGGFHDYWSLFGKSNFEIFQKCIPSTSFEDVCMKCTSADLEAAGEVDTDQGEFFATLG